VDDWSGLRTVLVIVVWVTVAGGALMAMLWTAFGGARALDPNDELLVQAGVPVDQRDRKVTSFTSAQVFMHGVIAILTASLITYAAVRGDDRDTGYIAGLVAVAVTAIPGILMFRKWRTGHRPAVAGASVPERRVEDRLPKPVVYLHGLAAAATAGVLVALLLLDQ